MSAPVEEVVFLKASAKERAASLPAVGIWALTSALISLRKPFMEGTTSTKTVPAWKPAIGAPPPLVSCVVPHGAGYSSAQGVKTAMTSFAAARVWEVRISSTTAVTTGTGRG